MPDQSEAAASAPQAPIADSAAASPAAKASARSATKPNFSAMRKRAEKRDPVAGKPLADDEMIQMTHYLTAQRAPGVQDPDRPQRPQHE
ncbi:hypothetical protein [Mesorhizobium helmanticense]|uniref:hypothetical protein n=1 Tax=Mesorhizobium helmanticense TaxID=1776423 RepID=UPI0011B2466C|nr:hypothetical protein [Mesorhizobium helmanticense]